MNKNTLIGFVLIAIVLIGFSWWGQKQAAEQQAAAQAELARQDSIAKANPQPVDTLTQVEKTAQQLKADSARTFFTAMQEQALDSVVLRNDKVELTIYNKGGVVRKAKVLGYKDYRGNADVTLFDAKDQNMSFALPVNAKKEIINTADLYFETSNVTDKAATMTATGADGSKIVISYELGDSYLLHFNIKTEGMDQLYDPGHKTMFVMWKDSCRQQEKGYTFENRYTSLTYKEVDGGTDHLSEGSNDTEQPEEALDWVAFKSQFFAAVLIPQKPFEKNARLVSMMHEKESHYLKSYTAELQTPFSPLESNSFEMYFGPNDFQILKHIEKQSQFGRDLDLEDLVYLGWWLVRWINRWFTLYIFDGLTALGLGMGIVLILITLLLKGITFPMVKKSYMSSAKMRVLKPKLEEATKQYDKPEDQMQKQQAMMQLYSQYGVSPLGGCLPMLIQMPIWIAMFFFVPNAIQLRGESFLWMEDLSTYDPIFEWSKPIWGIGDHLSLTCILFCVSNLLYSYMTMRQQRDQMIGQQANQLKMMQWMMYLMPVMFFFIFNDYSSGLNFYYFISLLFSAIIMWTLRKTTDDAKLLAILEANYKENKNNPKKQSGLAARLEAMQKQQEEMKRLREQMKKR
ncbi:MAG: membrane protein insertase YidC [Prevotella sp.]|nr:membrane protein insertase YidC [Prevotella sp.]